MEVEIISERGKFWLAGTENIAAVAIGGFLTVDEAGGISLKLDPDSLLQTETDDAPENIAARHFDICGLLFSSCRYVRLPSAYARRLAIDGTPQELGSSQCLVIDRDTSAQPSSAGILFDLSVPLGPAWPWLEHPLPTSAEVADRLSVEYPREMRSDFEISAGEISVFTELSQNHDYAGRRLTLRHEAWITLRPNAALNIDQAIAFYRNLEELFILLTDRTFCLPWPQVRDLDGEHVGTLYCTRRRGFPEETVSALECWVTYPAIADSFAQILENWLSMRQTLGAALHLYAGMRRAPDAYLEHRFISLVWGLESLYRRSGADVPSAEVDAKIARITSLFVDGLNSSDRHWLKLLMSRARHASLGEALLNVLSSLPLNFTSTSLQSFVSRCVARRNDISHYGGPRDDRDYREFVLELNTLCRALDPIYHAAILRKIGVSDEQVRKPFFNHLRSLLLRGSLKTAGLEIS